MNPKAWALSTVLLAAISSQAAGQSQTWTQAGMLNCRLNPSVGFIVFGHQTMECRFVPSAPLPAQIYEDALNTVGIDIGLVGTGGLAWAVLASHRWRSRGSAGRHVCWCQRRHRIGSRGRRKRSGRRIQPKLRAAAPFSPKNGRAGCHVWPVGPSTALGSLSQMDCIDFAYKHTTRLAAWTRGRLDFEENWRNQKLEDLKCGIASYSLLLRQFPVPLPSLKRHFRLMSIVMVS